MIPLLKVLTFTHLAKKYSTASAGLDGLISSGAREPSPCESTRNTVRGPEVFRMLGPEDFRIAPGEPEC